MNHSHYAGLMEMLVPIPLVLALSDFARGRHRKMAIVAAAVMASTIFLSGSRGGMVAFVVQLAVLAIISARGKKGPSVVVALGLFLLLVIGLLVWLGGAQLHERLSSIQTEVATQASSGTRLDIARDVLHRMFPLKPLLGFGLGVFPEIYPQYRSFYTNLYINEAHNDYLQLLVETGLLGFATMLWCIGIVYYRASKKLAGWTNDPNGALALVTLLGCTGILIHSFVDFNLQIPANAALFCVLCVLAALDSRFPRRERRLRRRNKDVSMLGLEWRTESVH